MIANLKALMTGTLDAGGAKRVVALYHTSALLFLGAALLYALAMAPSLTGAPLTGPLVTLTHIFTLGVILPQFMGFGYEALAGRYNAKKVSNQGIAVQFIIYHLALLPFLYFSHSLSGGPLMSISGVALFLSIVLYIRIVSKAFFTIERSWWKKGELWIDVVSLFYLFQTSSFGAMIATNLQTNWFETEIIRSIRLHSQSGMAGFFLLQFFILFWRRTPTQGGRLQKLLIPAAVAFVAIGLFLWTAVHDKNPFFFHNYYGGVFFGGVLFLLYAALAARAHILRFALPLLFFIFSLSLGGVLVYAPLDFLVEKSLFTVFGFSLFLGFFVFANFAFLEIQGETQSATQSATQRATQGATPGAAIRRSGVQWAGLGVSLVLVAASIYFGEVVSIRLALISLSLFVFLRGASLAKGVANIGSA